MTQEHAPLTGSRAQRIEDVLRARFTPVHLDVQDDSARHAGHAGLRHQSRGPASTGETHFKVTLISETFHGISRVQRSRAVHEALEAEFAGGLHALVLSLRTPEEQAAINAA
ncbi:BolA protein [Granulibacter bethesdensis]|uniref:BolA family protein n=1 Tax=Granulibacter bethesdensis TaxID=364410 RepID=UPI00090C45D8|nr:BolA family protein [Granulibacter bethesdensis]APH56433.1 BolA protein [Granulibacter bethesdensis]